MLTNKLTLKTVGAFILTAVVLGGGAAGWYFLRTNQNQTIDNAITENTPETPRTPDRAPVAKINYQAWIYPDEPSCDAAKEIVDGRTIEVLKPEYFSIATDGTLKFISADEGCNGFSKDNLDFLKKYSKAQFLTVSGHLTEMQVFFSNQERLDSQITTLVNFVVENDMTGVELDFEDFSAWSQKNYEDYLSFVQDLGSALRKQGKQLMVDGPAIADLEHQGWYKWRYEDFENLPVDYIVVMAYDYQSDQGSGKPVTPINWLENSTKWVLTKISDSERIVIGLPSYGYSAEKDSFSFDILTKEQMSKQISLSKLTRDKESYELIGESGNLIYVMNDTVSLDAKLTTIRRLGIANVSVWHLGGNDWFSR